jgi:hypothetical protein
VIAALRASVPLPEVHLNPPPRPVGAPSYPIAEVRSGHSIDLHASPGGKVIDRVGDRTEFGSVRVFWIERVRGAWFGVPVPKLPDGRLAWIKDDRLGLDVTQTSYWIIADVSRQLLQLHYGNRILDSFPVSVGSPNSPTPLGDYSATDGLVGRGLGPGTAAACSRSPVTSPTCRPAGSAATAWRSTARRAPSVAPPHTAACAPPTRT